MEVGTDDGGEAEGVLVDVDAHVLGGLGEGAGGVGELAVVAEFLIVGLGQLGLLFGFRALGLCQSDVARRAGGLCCGSGLRGGVGGRQCELSVGCGCTCKLIALLL